MPAPDAASYMLAITAHRGVGSAAEARDLLRFLGRTHWQPPDDALMQLLEIACGEAAGGGDAGDADGGSVDAARPRHRAQPVPPPWRDFVLRGTLPQGVTCLRFLADAAASAGTGALPEPPSTPQNRVRACVRPCMRMHVHAHARVCSM